MLEQHLERVAIGVRFGAAAVAGIAVERRSSCRPLFPPFLRVTLRRDARKPPFTVQVPTSVLATELRHGSADRLDYDGERADPRRIIGYSSARGSEAERRLRPPTPARNARVSSTARSATQPIDYIKPKTTASTPVDTLSVDMTVRIRAAPTERPF